MQWRNFAVVHVYRSEGIHLHYDLCVLIFHFCRRKDTESTAFFSAHSLKQFFHGYASLYVFHFGEGPEASFKSLAREREGEMKREEQACPLASPPDIDCLAEKGSWRLVLYRFEGYLECEVTAFFVAV